MSDRLDYAVIHSFFFGENPRPVFDWVSKERHTTTWRRDFVIFRHLLGPSLPSDGLYRTKTRGFLFGAARAVRHVE